MSYLFCENRNALMRFHKTYVPDKVVAFSQNEFADPNMHKVDQRRD
jgi:hypothetical protein